MEDNHVSISKRNVKQGKSRTLRSWTVQHQQLRMDKKSILLAAEETRSPVTLGVSEGENI